MSAVNIYLAPDAAHVFTDGAATDAEGRLGAISSKCLAVPHLNAVIASRTKNVKMARAVEHALASRFDDLESLLAGAPAMARSIVESFRAGAPSGRFDLMFSIAAWSHARGRAEAWQVYDETCAARHGVEPWTLLPLLGAVQFWPGNQNMLDDAHQRIPNAAHAGVWIAYMAFQRGESGVTKAGRERLSIGVFVQHTAITEHGIRQRIIHRWPDRLGQFLGEMGSERPGLVADRAAGPLDDASLAANSDSKIPTQKAVKAYVDANVGGASALDDLSDVDTTTTAPSTGDVLTFNGTDWVPDAPSGGGGAAWILAFRPYDNEPPSTSYATLDTRNSHPVLCFDATTQEAGIFSGVLPPSYAGGGITITAIWAAATATSGTIGWDVAIERIGTAQDLDGDSFAAAATITAATVSSTSGICTATSVNIADGTDMDSLAAGEAFRIRIRRDVANDNASGDAQLIAVTLAEQ